MSSSLNPQALPTPSPAPPSTATARWRWPPNGETRAPALPHPLPKQRSGPGVMLGARLLEPGEDRPCKGSALEGSSLARCGCGGGGVGCGSESAAGSGNVEEFEGSAGPFGAADGGHGGRRASEAAAGPAGRCHVTASSGARSPQLSPRAWRSGRAARARTGFRLLSPATRPKAGAEASGQGCSPERAGWVSTRPWGHHSPQSSREITQLTPSTPRNAFGQSNLRFLQLA